MLRYEENVGAEAVGSAPLLLGMVDVLPDDSLETRDDGSGDDETSGRNVELLDVGSPLIGGSGSLADGVTLGVVALLLTGSPADDEVGGGLLAVESVTFDEGPVPLSPDDESPLLDGESEVVLLDDSLVGSEASDDETGSDEVNGGSLLLIGSPSPLDGGLSEPLLGDDMLGTLLAPDVPLVAWLLDPLSPVEESISLDMGMEPESSLDDPAMCDDDDAFGSNELDGGGLLVDAALVLLVVSDDNELDGLVDPLILSDGDDGSNELDKPLFPDELSTGLDEELNEPDEPLDGGASLPDDGSLLGLSDDELNEPDEPLSDNALLVVADDDGTDEPDDPLLEVDPLDSTDEL